MKDISASGGGIVPGGRKQELSLPPEMIRKGLELAIKIEEKRGIQTPNPILKLPGMLAWGCISFSRDRKSAAVVGYTNPNKNVGLMVWKIAEKADLLVFLDAGMRASKPIGITSVALSSRGDKALIGYEDGSIYRCDITDRTFLNYSPLVQEASDDNGICALEFSSDGRYFAETTNLHIRVRDAQSGKEILHAQGYNALQNQLALSHGGDKLIISKYDVMKDNVFSGRYCALMDIEGKHPPVIFGTKQGLVPIGLAFSPDDKRIAAVDSDGILAICDAETGEDISRWRYYKRNDRVIGVSNFEGLRIQLAENPYLSGGNCVAISDDGTRILTGSGDKYMRLWTWEGKFIGEYPHEKEVVKVAFLADGERALSGCSNGAIYMWKLL
jgi:WD40 repeat protein